MIRNREFNILTPRKPAREILRRSSRLGFGRALGNFEAPHVAVRMFVDGDTRPNDEPIAQDQQIELLGLVRKLPGLDRMQCLRRIDEILFAPDLNGDSDFFRAKKALLIQDWGDVTIRLNVSSNLLNELCAAAAAAYTISDFISRTHGTNPIQNITVAYQSRLESAPDGRIQRYPDFSVDERGNTDLERYEFIDAFRIPIQRIMLDIKQEVSREMVTRTLGAARNEVESRLGRL